MIYTKNNKNFLLFYPRSRGESTLAIGEGIAPATFEEGMVVISTPCVKKLFNIKADFLLPDGEEVKTREHKARLEDALMEMGCGRKSTLVAVGGGALLDLVGFVAATYCRGVNFISIPTTLMAMTDACVGGKVGINVGGAKNYLGAFYPASKIYIDIDFLKTLPREEWLNGMAEIVKHALIASPLLFQLIQENWENRDPDYLLEMLEKSLQVKKSIVEEDFWEGGKRELLNLGHSIGHAIESALGYKIRHGEAVALGLRAECYLSMRMGFLSREEFDTISLLLEKIITPFVCNVARVKEALKWDKKNDRGKTRFVILEKIGKPVIFSGKYARDVEEKLIDEALHATLRHP